MGASPQFVDINGDGREDILISSYNGTPQWIERTEDGYGEPATVMDKNDNAVTLGTFWDYDEEDWGETDQTGTTGHCTSVAAVDWDNDGDIDLLLGGYRDGGLFLRLNEGSPTETKFATTNQPVKVGGEPIAFEGGIGSPRVADWDGDGLFDIVVGTISGEVVLLRNAGSANAPKFPEMTTLVELLPGKAGPKRIKRVLSKDGLPVAPGSSFHIDVVDYDGDKDLDLIVGGRSEWLTGPEKNPTKEDLERAKKLRDDSQTAWREFKKFQDTAEDDEAMEKLKSSDEYRSLLAKYHELRQAAHEVTADPVERGDFVWLFRQK